MIEFVDGRGIALHAVDARAVGDFAQDFERDVVLAVRVASEIAIAVRPVAELF